MILTSSAAAGGGCSPNFNKELVRMEARSHETVHNRPNMLALDVHFPFYIGEKEMAYFQLKKT